MSARWVIGEHVTFRSLAAPLRKLLRSSPRMFGTPTKGDKMTVFLVTDDDGSVVLTAANREVAIAAVKASYGPPYRVAWSEDADGNLVGAFEHVEQFSTAHVATFEIREAEVLA